MQHTKLILVRHGETEWNRNRRWQGQIDVALNELGRAQAKAVGQYLSKEKFEVILSSDLVRAHDTAAAIKEYHPTPIVADARLREMSFGEWEGMTAEEIDARHGEGSMAALLADRLHKVPPGGESVDALFERIKGFLGEILSTYRDKSILCVSHGGAIRALLSVLMTGGKTAWPHLELGNCSVSRVVWRGENRPVVQVIGDDNFLRN